MKKETIEKIADKTGWNVSFEKNGKEKYVCFQRYSFYGQDFFFELDYKNLSEIKDKIKNYYDNFDASEEAYLWLDSSGHGTNGAPYEMIDVYNDMKECEENIEKLYKELAA